MLRGHLILINSFFTVLLVLALSGVSCRQDTTGHSEEESAHMADYEAPVTQWGFINHEGSLVIRPSFDDAGPFSEGLAAVSKSGKWGYIDLTGKIVISPVFKSAWAFHEGFARVEPFDQPDQFIDYRGRQIQAGNWSAADDFSNGRARVQVGNVFGYIDTTGKMIIQPIYTRGWNFSNGLVVIEFQEKLGAIDLNGNDILPAEFDKIKKAANDSILLCKKNDTAFVYAYTGVKLLEIPNAEIIDSDGDIMAVRENNIMYLLDLRNLASRSSTYPNILYLGLNMWAGKTDRGYMLLDSKGDPLSPNAYDQINRFSEGFAAYSKNQLWGYLDKEGNEITGDVFGLAWDYREGYARAAFKEGIAFIDKKQTLAFYPPARTMDMRDFSEGLAAVQIE